MASLTFSWVYRDKATSHNWCLVGKSRFRRLQTFFLVSFPEKEMQASSGLHGSISDKRSTAIKCTKKEEHFDPSKLERPPYYSYLDSTSGELEPASGARASIPGKEYWPEGTSSRVQAARAPEPVGISMSESSYGKKPGSRRKKFKGHPNPSMTREISKENIDSPLSGDLSMPENSDDSSEDPKDPSEEYVIYQTEENEGILNQYESDKRFGSPHPFIDPSKKKPIEEPRSSEELWWNWRKPEKEQWSRWQRRRPDVDTVFAKAMAETGQIKLYGDHPTLTETALARARRFVFKEERLQKEQQRLEEIGPIAFYSEWVKAWKQDSSREAVQRHYEETGEDENNQLITMFQHQTAEEYRIMMGTDIRIKRDPLAMRMREDQIKEIWGGDPVYPTINYIQDPNEVIDYRGPDFHEPTPNMLSYLMEHRYIISRDELEQMLAKEKTEELEVADIDEAMARAVDIGENDDGDDSEIEAEDEVEEEMNEKITRNWSVLKSTPQLQKSKGKPKKEGPLSLDEAIDEAENLTDFLMDFEEDD